MTEDYINPLQTLLRLTSIYDDDTYNFMLDKNLGSGFHYPFFTEAEKDKTSQQDYLLHVKLLWDDYKRSHFPSLSEFELNTLRTYCGDHETLRDNDIFITLKSCNNEIIAFQKALNISSSSILLITDYDKIEEINIDPWDNILLYHNPSICQESYFEEWKLMTSSYKHREELLFYGKIEENESSDKYNTGGNYFLHLTKTTCPLCHIIESSSDFSCNIAGEQMPNYNPFFYSRLAKINSIIFQEDNSGLALDQHMKCHYTIPPAPLKRIDCIQYYNTYQETLEEINLPENINKMYVCPSSGSEIFERMCIVKEACYILDEDSIVAHHGLNSENKESKNPPVCLDVEYLEIGICVLEPQKDGITSNPLLIPEINRYAKQIKKAFRKYKTLTTKEKAFCISCIRLSNVENLKERIRKPLTKHLKKHIKKTKNENEYEFTNRFQEELENTLKQIVEGIVKLRRQNNGWLTIDYKITKDIRESRKGNRKRNDTMTRASFIKAFWDIAKDWHVILKNHESGKRMVNWQFFGEIFDVEEKSERDKWRKTFRTNISEKETEKQETVPQAKYR